MIMMVTGWKKKGQNTVRLTEWENHKYNNHNIPTIQC